MTDQNASGREASKTGEQLTELQDAPHVDVGKPRQPSPVHEAPVNRKDVIEKLEAAVKEFSAAATDSVIGKTLALELEDVLTRARVHFLRP